MHYLCNQGHTGWQGRLEDLQLYRQLRSQGDPSPLLRIAESWLRGEIQERKRRFLEEAAVAATAAATATSTAACESERSTEEKSAQADEKDGRDNEKRSRGSLAVASYRAEPAAGIAALASADPTQLSYVSGGGFSNGRMAAYDFIGSK